MAKFSVNGTEVIGDDALIDWTKVKNKPTLMTGANPAMRLEGGTTIGFQAITFYVENDGANQVRVVRNRAAGNCNCVC